jgi:hypothetical protein
MNARSLFKLVIYIINWLKISIIAFPVSFALISLKQGKLKYGYDFFDVDYNWAIVIAIGIGLVLNTWHAISFEELKATDLKQYLKVRQRYLITDSDELTEDDVRNRITAMASDKRGWTMLSREAHGIWLQIKNKYGFMDVVNLQVGNDGVVIESRPKYLVDFVDMARNLGNVQYISKHLKQSF